MASNDLNSTVGALAIGLVISTYLFGASTIQTVMYFQHSSRDSLTLRISVAIIWILGILHTVCFAQGTYTATVTHYGDTAKLSSVPSTIFLSFLFSGPVGPIVQCIYANRIRDFTGNHLVAMLSWTLSLLEMAAIAGLVVESIRSPTLRQLEAECSWLFTAALAIGAANDLALAVVLCWYFKRERKEALRRTARLLDVLILWTLNSGLLTSVAILAELITFVTMKQTFIWMAFTATAATLYSNSLLALLNGRERLRAYNTSTTTAGTLAELAWTAPASEVRSLPSDSGRVDVAVMERQRTPCPQAPREALPIPAPVAAMV
ncbi:hypothetical protein PLICRDRAFT_567474 [Plicaturopsis crispa FD-325 SS-3]|nr:hypothetical protein PLICRDRAFT_567474 [Plicaturopsis crispa FD-325 SS-3]